jgi:hypothetical protein
MASRDEPDPWLLDQLAKSQFFHVKLHTWELLETAEKINAFRGDQLSWNLEQLGIATEAWNKVIHHGVKPVRVFCHPVVLTSIARSTGYYRMLAMVSQKSMIRLRLATSAYEEGSRLPSPEAANAIAVRLNQIISQLLLDEERITESEFDLWRGMAAGTQAQGSWQNEKGSSAERIVRNLLRLRLEEKGLTTDGEDESVVALADGRTLEFADDPDIAIYANGRVDKAIEVKGGIDVAGVLERIGAAIKSLHRIKELNPQAQTILILQKVSVTAQAIVDLNANQASVNHWFALEDILRDEPIQSRFFGLLGL